MMDRLLGVILAGGSSRRFGSDKAAASWQGRPLIEHVADGLAPQVDALVVAGREWPGLLSLIDRPPCGQGPLAGLNAALDYAAANGFSHVLSCGCDLLPVPAGLATLLVGEAAAVIEGQPLLGRWPVALAPLLDEYLAGQSDRSMRGWVARCGAGTRTFPGTLYNINRPGDLAAMARQASD